MNYLNPVEYSKKLKALMEDESIETKIEEAPVEDSTTEILNDLAAHINMLRVKATQDQNNEIGAYLMILWRSIKDKLSNRGKAQAPTMEAVKVEGDATMKERISKLSPDEKKKLQEYVDAIKEIKKEIQELINKEEIEEVGGNMSSGLTLNPEE